MHILVIDDHGLFREGLIQLLKTFQDDLQFYEATTFSEAFSIIEKESDFQLVLMDLRIPDMNGSDALKVIHQRLPDVPIVIVSGVEDRESILRSINMGATGFIPKSSSSRVMQSALKLVLSGGVYIPPSIIHESGLEAGESDDHGYQTQEGRRFNLTVRQKDVLRFLAEGRSNRDIARELNLSESTVKLHVTALLKALNVTNRTQAVLKANQLGIVSMSRVEDPV